MSGRTVWFVVPDGVDDPRRVSGGNVYDRHLRDGLGRAGWDVRMVVDRHRASRPDDGGETDAVLSAVPDGATVLVDGLVALRREGALRRHGHRLRLVVLAHMVASAIPGRSPSIQAERRALAPARAVIATSRWTRAELVARSIVQPGRVELARPGTDPAPVAEGSRSGTHLLSLGVLAPHKGQDVLVRALAGMTDVPGWTCTIAGSAAVSPRFAAALERDIVTAGLADRVTMPGVLHGTVLGDAYRRADLVVVPSRAESYGMVAAEAMARGVPVVASRVGGLPEALVAGAAQLVAPGDADALRSALVRWCGDPARRRTMRAGAMAARRSVRRWDDTVRAVAAALDAVRVEAGAA